MPDIKFPIGIIDMSEIYTEKFPYSPNLTDKEIKRVYEKRRKLLQKGHCVRCGENLKPVIFDNPWFPERKGEVLHKGGITKKRQCPRCKTNLIKFCFGDLLDEAKAEAKEIVEKAKKDAQTPAKNSQRLNKKSSATKRGKAKVKKKCANKKSKKVKNKDQRTLW